MLSMRGYKTNEDPNDVSWAAPSSAPEQAQSRKCFY